MEEINDTTTNAGQGFGIAALVLGIVALITAPIPCIGLLALIPGVLGIIFAIIALVQARQENGAKALIIVALVLSSLGTAVSTIWVMVISTPAVMTNSIVKGVMNDLKNINKDFNEDIKKDLEEGNGEYTITIKKSIKSEGEKEEKLEELERNDSLENKLEEVENPSDTNKKNPHK